MFPLHCMFKLTLRKHLTDCLPNRQPNHYHAKDGTSKLPIFDRNYFKHDLSTVFSTDICRVKNIPKKSKYTIQKWLCQRYWLIGVYGTSKLKKSAHPWLTYLPKYGGSDTTPPPPCVFKWILQGHLKSTPCGTI